MAGYGKEIRFTPALRFPLFGITEQFTEIRLKEIRIFDENANELYCVSSDKPLINIRNDGERRHAADFCTEGCFYELDLSEILGNKFDSKAIYIAEPNEK